MAKKKAPLKTSLEKEYYGDESPVEEDVPRKPISLPTKGEVLRPSKLADMAKEAGKKPRDYADENGLPVPLRRYRVTGRLGARELPPVECDAVDSSAAYAKALADGWRVKPAHRHRVVLQNVVLEE